MSTAVIQRLPKPDWTNIGRRDLYKNIYIGLTAGLVGAAGMWYGWYIPKWEKIEDYERNYDPFAEMERMRNLGLFSCCPPDYVIEEKKQKALAKKKK